MNTARPRWPARLAQIFCAWAERWYPDSYVFAALAVILVALAAIAIGATPTAVAQAFGDGYWSLTPFTMQMCFVLIGGYVVAASPPVEKLIIGLAGLPKSGRGAVIVVALVSMLLSLLHWGLSLIIGGLLVRALGRREDLDLDYRAAGAAAYLGLGAVWALGLSSSAAQFQANAASIPPKLLAITGVIPFEQTIFLWQSMLMAAIIITISVAVAAFSAPRGKSIVTAADLGIDLAAKATQTISIKRPADWLDNSPLLSLALVGLGGIWLIHEFSSKGVATAIASLNTYNFLFLSLGLLLNWRPRRFLDAVARAIPGAASILIQFPLYAGIASLLTAVQGSEGHSLAQYLANFFSGIASNHSFALVMGGYSAVLGFFVPSGGGKWLIEAPYVMQSAIDLRVHLGWTVQIYNAAEALPNLINPVWMLPLLAVTGLKARDIVGFSFLQLLVHIPLVLLLLWGLGLSLDYQGPVMPAH